MRSTRAVTKQETYSRAFDEDFSVIWGATPFIAEIPNLSYFRAMTCFLSSDLNDIEDRRRLLYRYLENDFSADKPDDTINELYRVLPTSSGIPRIARNLCQLYAKPARRTFDVAEDGYNAVYRQVNVDGLLRKAHRIGKLTNNALLLPTVRNGRLEVDILPPDLFRVKTSASDFRQMGELWIPVHRRGQTHFHVWTNETYSLRNVNGAVVREEPNRYGVIPAALLQFEQSMTDFYGAAKYGLVSASLDDNKLRFLVDNNVVYTAFSVWVAVNFGKNANFKLAPNRVIQIDNVTSGEGMNVPPELQTVSPPAEYMTLEELRLNRYKAALRDEGLPEALVNNNPGIASSGVAMMVDRQELMEIRAEDIDVMRSFEQVLCDTIRVVANADLRSALPPVSIGVDYAEQLPYLEPQAEFDFYKSKFEYGVLSPKDFLKITGGNDLVNTDEEAMNYINTNKSLLGNRQAQQEPIGVVNQEPPPIEPTTI